MGTYAASVLDQVQIVYGSAPALAYVIIALGTTFLTLSGNFFSLSLEQTGALCSIAFAAALGWGWAWRGRWWKIFPPGPEARNRRDPVCAGSLRD